MPKTQTSTIIDLIHGGQYNEKFYEINYPGAWLPKRNQFKAIIERCKAEKTGNKKWKKLKPVQDQQWNRIVNWLNYVIREPNRECKRQNLWVCSVPNMGKTDFLSKPLMQRLKMYVIQKDPVQNTPWEGPYDLAICDEYSGQKPIEWMNEFMSDAPMQIRVVGGGFMVKDQWLPLLILSNLTIDKAYEMAPAEMVKAIKERFWQINLNTRENPFNIPLNKNQEAMNKIFE